jgi:hypothetical protein
VSHRCIRTGPQHSPRLANQWHARTVPEQQPSSSRRISPRFRTRIQHVCPPLPTSPLIGSKRLPTSPPYQLAQLGVGEFYKCELTDVCLATTVAIPALLIWGAAEIAMTIVAASIPFLRVLLREARSSNGLRTGYRYGYDHPGDNGYAFGSQGGTVLRSKVSITGGRPRTFIRSTTDSSMPSFSQPKAQRSGPRPSKGSPGDDGSDKSILNMPAAEGRIVQTQEVNVEYHQSPFASGKADSSSDAGDSYELGKIASG